MRKLVAAINMTLDGFCDHTAMIADDELHQHYETLLRNAGVILYGRITYHLMEYWKTIVENPTGNKATDSFAATMDRIPKVVFSKTLKKVDWQSARIASRNLEEEVMDLKSQPGREILVGSPGLIVALTNLKLIDEYQICIHPVILGKGLPLFKQISNSTSLNLLKTKTFGTGSIVLYYESDVLRKKS